MLLHDLHRAVAAWLSVALFVTVAGCSKRGGGDGDAPSPSGASPPSAPPPSGSAARHDGLVVDVPAGYTKVPADFPGLDPDTRAMIEAGDVFLQGERDGATLIAHARPNGGDFTNPEDCKAASTAMTRATGAKLVAAEVVELPFGKVCRSDVQFEDSKLIARNLSWRLENASSVTVMCNPFEEGEASGIACMRFAASVKAK